MNKEKVLVAIPVYNEGDRIEKTIESLKKVELIDEILIINDGSTDNTAEVIGKLGVSIITLEKNMGKGYAMKKAMDQEDYGYLAFLDGDLGDTSDEIRKLIAPVLSNEVDFTIAQFPSASTKGGFGFVKTLAREGVYFHTKTRINTSLSGQRVYKKQVLKDMKYMPMDFGIEVAMTIQALNNGYRLQEVPVTMTHRYSTRSLKGFKHRGQQFIEILKTLIIMLFRR